MCSNVLGTSARRCLHVFLVFTILGFIQKRNYSEALNITDIFPFNTPTDNTTDNKDDGGSGAINIDPYRFPFFTKKYKQVHVNNNGVISFIKNLSDYKPQKFPKESDPIIAPFWADVDTENVGGKVYYRQTTNRTLLARASTEIRNYFPKQRYFNATWILIVTWHEVGFYGANDQGKQKNNTFQCILITDEKYSFVIFNYLKITWTTGSNSQGNKTTGLGGEAAQAGFNAGDNKNYFQIPGAQTKHITNLTSTSNVGIPGKYVFRVDKSQITEDRCGPQETLNLLPRSGSMLGGENIIVSGPCYSRTVNITARIVEANVTFPCVFVDEVRALCVIPPIFITGELTFELYTVEERSNFSAVYTSVNIALLEPKIRRVNPARWLVGSSVSISWIPSFFPSDESLSIEMLAFKQSGDGPSLVPLTLVMPIDKNSGTFNFRIVVKNVNTALDSVAILRIYSTTSNPKSLSKTIWSDVFPLQRKQSISKDQCQKWMANEKKLPALDEVRTCPCILQQALRDTGRYRPDPLCNNNRKVPKNTNCLYYPNAKYCVRSTLNSSLKSGEICCYDRRGELINIKDGESGGFINRYHFRAQGPNIVPFLSHFQEDLLPYLQCCSYSNNFELCMNFTMFRPPSSCQSYQPPSPAQAAGDPHLVTLDGSKYTFNGLGEFILVQDNESSVVIQVRAEQAVDTEGVKQNATVFTAIAMVVQNVSDCVEIHMNKRDLYTIVVNGQELAATEEDMSTSELNGVTLDTPSNKRKDSANILVVLDSAGVSIDIEVTQDLLNVLVMVGSEKLKGRLQGLLGNYNGNGSDDFRSRNGTLVSRNASMEHIHYDFGMTWSVQENESLFTQTFKSAYSTSNSESYETVSAVYEPIFIEKIEENLRNGTREICGTNIQCIFDYQVTGSESVAKSTKNFVTEFNKLKQDIEPVVRCPHISRIENGNTTVENYSIGSKATFDCDEGFLLVTGSKVIICQADGTWSGKVAQCALYIPPEKEENKELYMGIAIGVTTLIALVVFVAVIFKTRKSCFPPKKTVTEPVPIEMPVIATPSNNNSVFQNQAFILGLQQLNDPERFKIPRPTYVDPKLFEDYF